jgi:hypothetical protein
MSLVARACVEFGMEESMLYVVFAVFAIAQGCISA